MTPGTAHALRRLHRWIEARLPQLIDEVKTTVTKQIPIYRDGSAVPTKDLYQSIEENLRFLVAALKQPQQPLNLSVPQGTGRRRAHQGVPLPEVLQVYRIGFATLWDTLVDRARDVAGPAEIDVLLANSALMWKVTDEHATALTEAYRAATAELLVAQQHRRSALVEILLTGHVDKDAGPWEAAAHLGFPSDSSLAVVATQTRGIAEAGLPGVEEALAARGIVSGWRLTPSVQFGVVSLQPEQRKAMLETLRTTATSRTGVSPLYRAPSDTPRARRLARAALAQLAKTKVDVRMFSSSPVAALMVNEPNEGGRLAHEVLDPVLRLPTDDRATLLRTLEVYIECSGSPAKAAAHLHCHPNTVRYRLRRVQELTGRSLNSPNDVAELVAAVYSIGLDNE